MMIFSKDMEKEFGVSIDDAEADIEDNTPKEFLGQEEEGVSLSKLENKHPLDLSDEDYQDNRSYVEKFIESLPASKREEFYRIIFRSGLREDDYLWTVLHIMGYIKTMYEDIPGAIEDASIKIQENTEIVDEKFKAVIAVESSRLKLELSKQIKDFEDKQEKIIEQYKVLMTKNNEVFKSINKSMDKIIEDKKMQITNTFVESIKKDFPEIVNQHLLKIQKERDGRWFTRTNLVVLFLGTTMGALISVLLPVLLKHFGI